MHRIYHVNECMPSHLGVVNLCRNPRNTTRLKAIKKGELKIPIIRQTPSHVVSSDFPSKSQAPQRHRLASGDMYANHLSGILSFQAGTVPGPRCQEQKRSYDLLIARIKDVILFVGHKAFIVVTVDGSNLYALSVLEEFLIGVF